MDHTLAGRPGPESRYGRAPMPAPTSRHVRAALAALTVLLGVGVAVVAYQRFEGVDVKGKMAAYEILDDRTVAVTVNVTRKNPARPVVCIVRARSRDGAETGRREVVVGPSESRTVQITANVTTYRPPFVGDVYGCGTEVPGYLRQP